MLSRMLPLCTALLLAVPLAALPAANQVAGDYLEVRSCDVFTGPCYANGEMGLSGKEAILVWSVRSGVWNGTVLDGLKVIAVVNTSESLGDVNYHPQSGKCLIIVDATATPAQRDALVDMVRTLGENLVGDVVELRESPIEASIGACDKSGCASVRAGGLVEISTRCLGGQDHLCGNETTYYPPLTQVDGAVAAFTSVAAYRGEALGRTWQSVDRRSAFLATFRY